MLPYTVLETLFRHHLWANLRLLNACKMLTDQQLQTSIVGGYGSIDDTLQHMVRSEYGYFMRVSTGEPYDHPSDAPPLTFAEMAESLRISGEGLIEWAPRVQPDTNVQVNWKDGTSVSVPLAIFLTQSINHATEHRAQIMAILTQLGIEPPDLSSWSYFEAKALTS